MEKTKKAAAIKKLEVELKSEKQAEKERYLCSIMQITVILC